MCDRCNEIDWDCTKTPKIVGGQFGIDFYNLPYTSDGKRHLNPQFRIFTEDDELWHFTGFSASVFWLKDLLDVVREAVGL